MRRVYSSNFRVDYYAIYNLSARHYELASCLLLSSSRRAANYRLEPIGDRLCNKVFEMELLKHFQTLDSEKDVLFEVLCLLKRRHGKEAATEAGIKCAERHVLGEICRH